MSIVGDHTALAPAPMSPDQVADLIDRARKNAAVAREEGRRKSIQVRGHMRWDSQARRWVKP